MNYIFEYTKKAIRTYFYEVEANSPQEAKKLAWDAYGDWKFNDEKVLQESSRVYETITLIDKCPFCGGPGGVVESDHEYWVECAHCGAWRGNVNKTRAEAIKLWNKRYSNEVSV